MSTRQNLYSVDAALNRIEYSGDHMSNKGEDHDNFTHTVSPESDANDFSNFIVQKKVKGHQMQACLLFIIFITKL